MTISAFGKTADGRQVDKITLAAGDLTVSLLTWGGVLQSVRLAGVAHDLTLGSDQLADYEGDLRYHGAIIAPVVNRLTNAQALLDGHILHFETNFNGRHNLHSGSTGAHAQLWEIVEAGADHAALALDMPDGLGGFPGNRRLIARFSVTAPATLRLELAAETDAPTLFNATNHSYWTMDGGADWTGQHLRIAAEAMLPTDEDFVPTGEIMPVAGTPFDFRAGRAIAPGEPPLDNCFCLGAGQVALRPVLWLRGASGLEMEVATTEPGVQVYDGRGAQRPGGGYYEGIAVETQGWPDAPNKPGFPPIRLAPGAPLRQITEWRFAKTPRL
ncbi:aldose epimerase family protein [Tabrizicola fusiformis]|uniref:aldose epimerase family protein n=1 Tax=Tabrizicola sp. SY72 TaxID=2741673 RepID=UPI001574C882|nr:aldose epimerase family protein [Tabrizicola sp. SY72]NTT86120.1 galactose mutarotase [Tabrizicola sp. SY72]